MADWHPSDLGAKLYAFWDFADSAKITASAGVVSSVALSNGTIGTLDLLPGVDGGTVFNPTTDATSFGGIPSLVIGPNKNLKAVVDLGTALGLTVYVGLKSNTANFRSKLASFSQSTWDDSEPDSFGMHQHGDGVSSNSVEFYRDGFGGSKTPSDNIVSTETFSSIFFAAGGGICRATGKGSNFNTNAAVAFNGSTRFAIGANANADWADHLPSGCYVSFAAICLSELTPDEREKLDAWDAWRRGYQSKVRKSSPYSLAKPTTTDAYLVSLAVTEPYVNNANWQGYTIRQVYPASMLALSGSSIKLSFPPQNINISKCYIGHRSGTTLNFDGTPAQVLFGGSPSASLTVAGGVALFSDATTFALDETKDVIISVYFNPSGQSDILQADHNRTGVIRAYTNSPGDDAANITAASYNTGTTREALVDHILVAASGGGPGSFNEAASFAATGVASFAGLARFTPSVSFAASGLASFAGIRRAAAALTLSGTLVATPSGIRRAGAALALAGVAGCSVSAAQRALSTVALAATLAQSQSGKVTASNALALAASGAAGFGGKANLAAATSLAAALQAMFSGSVVGGSASYEEALALAAVALVTPSGKLTAVGALALAGLLGQSQTSNLVGSSTLSLAAAGSMTQGGSARFSGSLALASVGVVNPFFTGASYDVAMAVAGLLGASVAGFKRSDGALALSGALGALTAVQRLTSGNVGLSASASASASGRLTLSGSVSLGAAGSMLVGSRGAFGGSVGFTAALDAVASAGLSVREAIGLAGNLALAAIATDLIGETPTITLDGRAVYEIDLAGIPGVLGPDRVLSGKLHLVVQLRGSTPN